METLAWLQNTAFSTWIRESDWAIFAFLIVHTVGMAFLAGTSIATMLRILGVASRVPLSLFAGFIPLMTYGLMAIIVSGVLLVVGYPAKALTNPLFYVKLTVVTTAYVLTRKLTKRLFADSRFDLLSLASPIKSVAAVALLLWITGIAAGKFLAYTNTILLIY